MRILENAAAVDDLRRGWPMHDNFCRCRICKPPLPGEQRMEETRRFEIGAVVLLIVGAIVYFGGVM